MVKKQQKTWKIFKNSNDILYAKSLLKEFNIYETTSEFDTYLTFGYKMLSTGDKETYYFLKQLKPKIQNQNTNEITVSLDYLAICLGTDERTQRRRLKNLEEVALIQIIKTQYKVNRYIIYKKPLPDSTFIDTIEKLIARRKIKSLIAQYIEKTNNMLDVESVLDELYQLYSLNDFNKKYIDTNFKNFKIKNKK